MNLQNVVGHVDLVQCGLPLTSCSIVFTEYEEQVLKKMNIGEIQPRSTSVMNTGLPPVSGKYPWAVGDGDQPCTRYQGYQHVP